MARAPIQGQPIRASAPDTIAIANQVAALVQRQLGAAVGPEQQLMEAGLDSLGAVELRTSLGAAFGVELPATFTFDYPTGAAMSRYLTGVVGGMDSQVGWAHSTGLHSHKLFASYPILQSRL